MLCNAPSSRYSTVRTVKLNGMGIHNTTRDRILDAAMELVRDHGPVKLTLDESAKCAGVSKGGVLYHFKTKDDLIRGMVRRLIDQCEALHRMHYENEQPGPYRWARSLVRTAFDPNGPVHDPVGAAMLAAVALNPDLVAPLQAKYQEWMARVKSDSPDFERACVVCMAMDGYVLQRMLGVRMLSDDELERVKVTVLDLLR